MIVNVLSLIRLVIRRIPQLRSFSFSYSLVQLKPMVTPPGIKTFAVMMTTVLYPLIISLSNAKDIFFNFF